jgi:hypothetical protein
VLAENGLIKQIVTHKGEELLECRDHLGGEIRARIEKQWMHNRLAQCSFYAGPVCDIMLRETQLGRIPVLERFFFFKNQPLIKAEVEFDFNADTIGHSWIDKTKANVYYPTKGNAVYHDIPFGYVRGAQSKPLFAISWLYCGGLVYVNGGNVKHWVEDGTIANVLAWGSNHFTNRHHWTAWTKRTQYDLRLYGKQKIVYYLIPFGDFDGNTITTTVNAIITPTFRYHAKGTKSFYRIEDKDIIVTGIYGKDGIIRNRGYKLPTGNNAGLRDWEIFDAPLKVSKGDLSFRASREPVFSH